MIYFIILHQIDTYEPFLQDDDDTGSRRPRGRLLGKESGLSLKQKEYAYHLAEAAKYGRDILWDQNCKDNLRVRHAVENILENYKGDRKSADFEAFTVYAKRLFFSNGMHHHYAEDKFFPACPAPYFAELLRSS